MLQNMQSNFTAYQVTPAIPMAKNIPANYSTLSNDCFSRSLSPYHYKLCHSEWLAPFMG